MSCDEDVVKFWLPIVSTSFQNQLGKGSKEWNMGPGRAKCLFKSISRIDTTSLVESDRNFNFRV